MHQEYDTFIDGLRSLSEGQEVELFIRNLSPGQYKYLRQHVRALVSPREVAGWDRLWIRSLTGVPLTREPWSIKIAGELEEFLPGHPHSFE